MSTSTPDPSNPRTDQGREAPAPAADAHTEPEWSVRLRALIEELPGKIKATITPEDHEALGQSVWNFFDKGGAFEKPGDNPQDTKPDDGNPAPDTPPETEEKPEVQDSIARKLFGAQ